MAEKNRAAPNLRLRRARELRGWSQSYVAERVKAPAASYMSRWERGEVSPSPYYREKLCELFGMNALELGLLQEGSGGNSSQENQPGFSADGEAASGDLPISSFQNPSASRVSGSPRLPRPVLVAGPLVAVLLVVSAAVTSLLLLRSLHNSANSSPQPRTPQEIYRQATHGEPILNDPLSGPGGNNWDEWQIAGYGQCAFTQGAYHASVIQQNRVSECIAHSSNFGNFAFQVQMTIIAGDVSSPDGGGLIFRNTASGGIYRFRVGLDGTYDLFVARSGGGTASLIRSTHSRAIRAGLNRTNLLTVVALNKTIFLYINGQYVEGVDDTSSSVGHIGVFAVEFGKPTQIVYSHARVWKV